MTDLTPNERYQEEKLKQLFHQWLAEVRKTGGTMDPRDSDLVMQSFGHWLTVYTPEFASND